jgi:hypothetical protein
MPKTHVATLQNCYSQMLTQAFMICIGQNTLLFYIFAFIFFILLFYFA